MAPPKNYVPSSRRTTLRPFSEGIYKQVPHRISDGDFCFPSFGVLVPLYGRLGWVYLILIRYEIWILLSHSSQLKTKLMDAINQTKKRSLNIDFAPMVDLGFLLITFFIFTTKLTEAKAFKLNMPDDGPVDIETNTIASGTITLQLKGNGVVDYYEGFEQKPLQKGTLVLYAQNSVRTHLIDKRNRILQKLGTDSNYVVLIEPTAKTSYKEVIDVLDEMKILDINKYVLLDGKQ
jgi:biopolymer transport protein ExbD